MRQQKSLILVSRPKKINFILLIYLNAYKNKEWQRILVIGSYIFWIEIFYRHTRIQMLSDMFPITVAKHESIFNP